MTLDPEDAARLIDQTRSENAVLVGGQAVHFWARQFNLRPRLDALTVDIDFLATRAEAKRIAAQLKLPHAFKLAPLDDHAPNSAVLSVRLKGYRDPVVIDFMGSIVGPGTRAIEKAAVAIEFNGQPLRVIHPLHLLESKISNLHLLSAKRSPEGIEQARLAIEIVAAFLARAPLTQRDRLKAIEAIGKFSATTPARYARESHGLDCLQAVPASLLKKGALPENFLKKRWPQIVASAGSR